MKKFLFFHYCFVGQVKNYQRNTDGAACNLFSFSRNVLAKFFCKIKEPTPAPPIKAVELMQKKSDYQCFAPWFVLFIFQPCCGNYLRKISLANLK